MLFNSYIFIFMFLPMVWAGFFLLARRSHHWATAFLALASLFFYGYWQWSNLPILLASIGGNYWFGRQLVTSARHTPRVRKLLLIIAITLNLAALVYFKYANFFLDSINMLWVEFGFRPWEALRVMLPLGVSFYTFTQIGFLVDSYQGKVHEKSLTHYGLFVTFFPHLIAGPILHHKQVMPQFDAGAAYRVQWDKVALGMAIFTIGLSKKLLMADPLGGYADLLYGTVEAGSTPSFGLAWLGSLAYTFQVYFDFSGYSDMAVGLGLLFGIVLPMNFNAPYKATSIISFWQRWHMTLASYVWEYVYTPLTLAMTRRSVRKGRILRTLYSLVIPTTVTFFLIGLWHAASWTYVVFGLVQAVLMIINYLWRQRPNKARHVGPIRQVGYWLLTFTCIHASIVLFRAESLASALAVYESMLGLHGGMLASIWQGVVLVAGQSHLHFMVMMGLAFAITLGFPSTAQMVPPANQVQAQPAIRITDRRWLAAAFGVLFVISVLHISSKSPFLYFQF